MENENKIEKTTFNQPIVYNVTEEGLSMLEKKWADIPDCSDKAGYNLVKCGVGEMRGLRVSVERRRKELKSDALAYGKEVDATAKKIIARLDPIEKKLRAAKDKIDEAEARDKAEKVRIERERVEGHKSTIVNIIALGRLEYGATLDTMRANLDAVVNVDTSKEALDEFSMEAQVEQARVDELLCTVIASETARIEAEKKVDAELKRIAEQQRIEAERLAEEHAKQERVRMELEERQEAQRKDDEAAEEERKRLADEAQAKIDADNARVEAERAAKQKAIDDAAEEKRAAEDARRRAENERIEAEASAKREAEERRLEAERQELEAERQRIEAEKAEQRLIEEEKERERLAEEARKDNAEQQRKNRDDLLHTLRDMDAKNELLPWLICDVIIDGGLPHVKWEG